MLIDTLESALALLQQQHAHFISSLSPEFVLFCAALALMVPAFSWVSWYHALFLCSYVRPKHSTSEVKYKEQTALRSLCLWCLMSASLSKKHSTTMHSWKVIYSECYRNKLKLHHCISMGTSEADGFQHLHCTAVSSAGGSPSFSIVSMTFQPVFSSPGRDRASYTSKSVPWQNAFVSAFILKQETLKLLFEGTYEFSWLLQINKVHQEMKNIW